jgi:hypothetical protein
MFINSATKVTRYERTLTVDNKSFEPVDRTSPVSAEDFAISEIPSGFLYTDRDTFGRINKEMFTEEFGKEEYEQQLKAFFSLKPRRERVKKGEVLLA